MDTSPRAVRQRSRRLTDVHFVLRRIAAATLPKNFAPIIDDEDEVEERLSPLTRLDTSLGQWKLFNWMERTTGLPKCWIFIFGLLLTCVLIVANMGVNRTGNIVAFVYPAYKSYKTLEGSDVVAHVHCLAYWVTFSIYTLLEGLSDFFLYWCDMLILRVSR